MTTTAADDPLATTQRAAIRDSAWGTAVRIIQFRNFTFWVFAVMLAGAVMSWYAKMSSAFAAYTPAVVTATVVMGLYAALFLWIITRLDRYASLPANVKVVAFLWGGLVATYGLAANFNRAMFGLLSKFVSAEFAVDWRAAISAPISEEISKGLVVVLILGLAPRVLTSALDGFVLGMISGIAFEVIENVQYAYGAAGAQFGQSVFSYSSLAFRSLLGAGGHWVWSGIFGAGVVYLIGRPTEPARRLLGVVLMLSPMLLHGLWDSGPNFVGGNTNLAYVTVYPILLIAAFSLFVWTYRKAASTEQLWMRQILAPEVEAGVLLAPEVDGAVGTRRQRRRFVKAAGGRQARRSVAHVLEATHDLADALAGSNGEASVEVDRARSELARLRSSVPS